MKKKNWTIVVKSNKVKEKMYYCGVGNILQFPGIVENPTSPLIIFTDFNKEGEMLAIYSKKAYAKFEKKLLKTLMKFDRSCSKEQKSFEKFKFKIIRTELPEKPFDYAETFKNFSGIAHGMQEWFLNQK